MNTFVPIANLVSAVQHFDMNADQHPELIRCTVTEGIWDNSRILKEIPPGRQVFGSTVKGLKNKKTGIIMEVHDTDWLLFTEHGTTIVLPNHIMNALFKQA